ncbi:Transcriptional regulator, LysR-family [Cupriavidus necator]|uniref:LysR family transcriptional regulator n=1 Tax=Cupriavidus necator TaxID=106590 RepID=UPI003F73CD4E
MNLIQLKHMIALAETGSFSQAAARLHLTQPALSRSIQALEAELGMPLVDRIGKRNELTPFGQLALERARRIVFEAGELRQSALALQAGQAGTLRIGLGSGPGAMLMTPLLVHMARHHPRVRLTISRGATNLQLQQLRARALDGVVIDLRSLVPGPDLRVERLPDLRAGFMCRSGHPLCKLRRVSFDDLLAYPIASSPLSDEVARILIAHFGPRAHPDQMVTLRCEEISSLVEAARITDAVFLGIIAAAREPMASGELVELALTPPLHTSAQFALITLQGRTETPAMEMLRAFMAERMRE